MKLSSISLTIAATLVVIAGSVIATPAPRTLEQVKSFERDVDIYSRQWKSQLPHQYQHDKTARTLKHAIDANSEAVEYANRARHTVRGSQLKDYWRDKSARHLDLVDRLSKIRRKHVEAAANEKETPLYQQVGETRRTARVNEAEANDTVKEAKQDIRHAQLQDIRLAALRRSRRHQ